MSIQQLTGQFLGQYELRELLGVGGMGAVYRSYQARLKRDVAVKVLTPDLMQHAGYVERFTREAETAAKLEHRHIVPIYDYGTQQGVTYVVMRLLTGGTLSDRLSQHLEEDKPLPSLSETADVIKQLASALDYAHSQGVIHRDIKASNVMFDNQGSAYLVDFGIAKLVEATQSLTGTGVAMGTPLYMSPEQWRAEPLTPATDQYALAVMTYTLVTGRPPFEATTPFALMHKHLNEPPTPPEVIRPSVPAAVSDVLARALAKDPADRFPTITAFALAFEKITSGHDEGRTGFFTTPVRPRPVPRIPVTPGGSSRPMTGPDEAATAAQPIYKNPVIWGLVAVIVVMAAIMLVLLTGGGDDTPPSAGQGADTTMTPSITPSQTQSAVVILATETPAPTGDTTCRAVTATGVNVRQGPGTAYDVIGSAPADARLVVTGQTTVPDVWWQVDYEGSPGWIFGELVTLEGTCEAIPALAAPATSTLTPTQTLAATATLTPTQPPVVVITDTPEAIPTEEPIEPTDGPPIIEPLPNLEGGVGEEMEVGWVVTDVEGDITGALVESSDPDTVTVGGLIYPPAVPDNVIAVTLIPQAPGTVTITLTVEDESGQRAQSSFTLTVIAPPTATPTATATEAPTHTPTVTPSLTPSPTPSLTPSPEPSATHTPAPSPTPQLTDCQRSDMNGSGGIDIFDVRMVAATYNSTTGAADFVQNYDLDGNGTINIFDLRRITAMYGEACQ